MLLRDEVDAALLLLVEDLSLEVDDVAAGLFEEALEDWVEDEDEGAEVLLPDVSLLIATPPEDVLCHIELAVSASLSAARILKQMVPTLDCD